MGCPKQGDITSCIESVPVVGEINVCFTPVTQDRWSRMTSAGGKFFVEMLLHSLCYVRRQRRSDDIRSWGVRLWMV
jgi:hypothetical protein